MKPIFDAEFWRVRLAAAVRDERAHAAVFDCPLELWNRIRDKHISILRDAIGPEDSVLDVGCGWGRLLGMLPPSWAGEYAGVDISPDFIALARSAHPGRLFLAADARDGQLLEKLGRSEPFSVAVLISVRGMVLREAPAEWSAVRAAVRAASTRQLYLEYDPHDDGRSSLSSVPPR